MALATRLHEERVSRGKNTQAIQDDDATMQNCYDSGFKSAFPLIRGLPFLLNLMLKIDEPILSECHHLQAPFEKYCVRYITPQHQVPNLKRNDSSLNLDKKQLHPFGVGSRMCCQAFA